jgi:CspA family cold shock protein
MKSRVKWFNDEKGYGFLEYDGVEDVFVHYSQIECEGYKTLREGAIVEYELLETVKGLQAKKVKTLAVSEEEIICT